MCDCGCLLDSASLLLPGGDHRRIDRDDTDTGQGVQLSGYSHTARIGPHLKADGQAYRPAGAYGYYNKIKGANPGNLSEDDNHYRFSGGDTRGA